MSINNRQSREKLVTLGTQDTGRRQTKQKHKTQKTKTLTNTNPCKTQTPAKESLLPQDTAICIQPIRSIRVRHHYAQTNTNNANKT